MHKYKLYEAFKKILTDLSISPHTYEKLIKYIAEVLEI